LKDANRSDALEYVDKNWTDMRPKSLVEAMEGASETTAS
jgi:MbtH protein